MLLKSTDRSVGIQNETEGLRLLASFSVKKPYTIAVCVVLIIVLGVISFMGMTTDLLPGLNLPYILIVTASPGASPEKVELSVTKPIESTISTISGLKEMQSISQENSSMVMLEFAQDTNMDTAMIELSALLDLASANFEDTVGSPMMMRISPDMLPVMVLSADSDGMDLYALSKLVQEEIQPSIERINGVGSVSGMGILEKEISFTLDQKKIDALNLDVLRAVDEELAKAQQELDDARNELADGKSKLERERDQRGKELAEAGIAITEGKRQLQDGIAQIDEVYSQLETLKKALPAIKELIATSAVAYDELLVARDEMEQAIQLGAGMTQVQAQINDPSYLSTYDSLYSAYNAAADGSPEKEAARQLCVAYLAPLNAVVGALPVAGLPDLSAPVTTAQLTATVAVVSPLLDTAISLLPTQSDLAALDQAIREIDGAVSGAYKELDELLDPLDIHLPDDSQFSTYQRISAIHNSIVQIEKKIKELEIELPRQKAELEDTLADLSDKQLQLEQGKMVLTTELAKAGAAIDIGEQQLEQGQKQFDEAREEAYKQAGLDGVITGEMIARALAAQNFSMPAGYVHEGEAQYMVKVGEQIASVQELNEMVLFHADVEGIGDIFLHQVGEVTETDNSEDLYAVINGNEGVVLMVQKQSLASTAEVCELLRAEMAQLEQAHPGLHLTALQDQGVYINIVVSSVIENLLYGGLLAILVLIIFLRDWKPTTIIALSIPISLMFSVVLMYFSGVTLNLISLSGLALGVGMLVDNSIVAIENIYRLRSEGVPLLDACMRGVAELSAALTASTLTTVSVFLPIVFTHGITRELFTDMALTITYSLMSSLIVALTLVPAMGSALLGNIHQFGGGRKKKKKFSIYDNYEKLLRYFLRHKAPLLIAVVALLAFSGITAYFMGTQMFPAMESTQISVTMETEPGVTNEEIRAMSDTMLARIAALPDVRTVGAMQQSGGAMMGGGGLGHSISMYVLLNEKQSMSNAQLGARIEELGADLGCEITVESTMMDMSALTGSGITVNIKGREMDTLYAIAGEIAGMLEHTAGTANIDDGMEDASTEVRIAVHKNEAMRYNLTTAQVYMEVAAALSQGSTATTLTIESEDIPLVVRQDRGYARDTIKNLPLTVTEEGEEKVIALEDIAEIAEALSPTSITHDGQVRMVSVSAEIAEGYNVGLVTREFQRDFNAYAPPEGYTAVLEGENEEINNALRDVALMILLAIVLIYGIMVAQFQSLLSPFIVLFTIPLAFTGGLLALIICGFEISIVGMIGMLMLAGVVVNNGIVFVDTVNQLRMEGVPKRRALVQTGRMRMRPILMTALTTILALLTMALGIGAGSDMMQPLAVVTIGGLSYATLLTLFVVPVMYDMLHKKPMRRRESQEEREAREAGEAQAESGTGRAPGRAPQKKGRAGEAKKGERDGDE